MRIWDPLRKSCNSGRNKDKKAEMRLPLRNLTKRRDQDFVHQGQILLFFGGGGGGAQLFSSAAGSRLKCKKNLPPLNRQEG